MASPAPARGKEIRLEDVEVVFGDFRAVKPTRLTIEAGEFFSILGPSGCGKTTLLRLISGFIEPTAGRVLIGGEDMAGRGPNVRPTAMIFQSLALFPLMSVRENVAFGLEARGVGRAERLRRADELLDFVALGGQGGKKPSELSGGQRQRVAIARALAVEPSVLLLDEPLSALDLKLRQLMRAELKALQRKSGVTFVYITHDQGEALTMSDRVAVMNAGAIEQVGAPEHLYAAPATPFVATFIGEQNRFAGTVLDAAGDLATLDTPLGRLAGRPQGPLSAGAPAVLMVRPERLRLGPDGAGIPATIERRSLEGPYFILHARAGEAEIIVHAPNTGEAPAVGARVGLGFAPHEAMVFAGAGP
jgi:spermidine/putrescine transport system ATP-binding protein